MLSSHFLKKLQIEYDDEIDYHVCYSSFLLTFDKEDDVHTVSILDTENARVEEFQFPLRCNNDLVDVLAKHGYVPALLMQRQRKIAKFL